MKKRILSLLLCIVMCLSLMPMSALADGLPVLNANISTGGILSWDTLEGAASYYWNIGKGEKSCGGNAETTSIDLNSKCESYGFSAGDYEVTLYARNSSNTRISEEWKGTFHYNSTQETLDAPTSLRVEDSICKWNAVTNATSYIVAFQDADGRSYGSATVNDSQYAIDPYNISLVDGQGYKFMVKASAAGYVDSEYSESALFTYSKPSTTVTLQNVTISGGILSWDALEGAASYYWNIGKGVKSCGGNAETTSIDLNSKCESYDFAAGDYDVTLYARNSSNTRISEEWKGTFHYDPSVPITFKDLPEAGVTNITVPEGDYDTEVAVKDAFIFFWNENIKTDGEFVLVDCFDVDENAYHMWIVSFENDVISAMHGGYSNLDTILYSINNPNPIYDWWINGTFTVDAEDTPITSVTISGFENPAAGATAGSLSNLTVAADAPYELKTHSDDCTIWLWGGRRMKTDEAFAKNQQYNISTGLKAKDGYYFSDTCTYELLDTSGNEVQIYAGIACEVPNAKAADIHTPAILLGESGPVTVYNIVLDPNGGSGERSVVIVEKGSVYTIPECSFGLPEGKADFAYWKASFADGSEKTFLPGEKWTADDIMTTLTAMWSSRGVPALWLGDTPVTDDNKDNILGDTGTPTASFDSETNTLTLNHPDISGLHEGALIFAKNMNLTIKAADGLTLNNSDGYGIYVKNGSLTVEGNVTGTLSRYALMADKITVRGNLDFTHSKTYGATIGAVVGDIEIDGNVKLNATSTYFADDAIAANSSVRIDGDVTVSGNYIEGLAAYGGTVTMTSGQWDISANDTAIRASGGISIPSGYTITTPVGGKISAVGENVFYYVTESNGTTVAKDVVIEPPAITDDVTYYTLTFNTNGGSAISSVSGTYGKVIDLDKYVPTKSGFDFGGWYSDSALTAPVDEIKLNGNKTVYAKWIEKSAVFPFTDVKETDWSYDDIYYVWEKGLMQGTSETTFAPKTNTSRAMIVTILWRLEGEPVVNYAMSFDDVADGQWYTEAIRWAQSTGIVKGYSADEFGPDDPITREQMAAILYNYAKYKGQGFTGDWMFLLDFTDAGDISDWANEAMHWCVMKNLVRGVGNDLLDPQGLATREQVAAILHRFCEVLEK